jgi:hypothetical protein
VTEPDSVTKAIMRVLRAHELQWVRPYHGRCSCGTWESRSDAANEFKAHVADELVMVYDQHVLRSEARLRTRLVRKLGVMARQAAGNTSAQRALAAAARVVQNG